MENPHRWPSNHGKRPSPAWEVVPWQYGFPRRFALGNLREAPLAELARRWLETGYQEFNAHCRDVHARVVAEAGLPLLNWYERAGLEAAAAAHDAR